MQRVITAASQHGKKAKLFERRIKRSIEVQACERQEVELHGLDLELCSGLDVRSEYFQWQRIRPASELLDQISSWRLEAVINQCTEYKCNTRCFM